MPQQHPLPQMNMRLNNCLLWQNVLSEDGNWPLRFDEDFHGGAYLIFDDDGTGTTYIRVSPVGDPNASTWEDVFDDFFLNEILELLDHNYEHPLSYYLD